MSTRKNIFLYFNALSLYNTNYMTNSDDIEKSFSKTIKSPELREISLDIADVGIDGFLGEGIIKELPVVKIVYALAKGSASMHDKLFLKKIVSFLTRIKDVAPEKRQNMIDDIDNSKKYRIKVGEKLLYILDSCNDYEASELVGELFRAFLTGTISYDDYLSAANVVESLPAGEVEIFVRNYSGEWEDINNVYLGIYTGLYEISYDPVNIDVAENDDYKDLRDGGSKYKASVDGGTVQAKPNRTGEIIYLVLKNYFA